jgi:hypothetical protein
MILTEYTELELDELRIAVELRTAQLADLYVAAPTDEVRTEVNRRGHTAAGLLNTIRAARAASREPR